MAYSGKFSPTNPQKYDGNPTTIIFRSTWEYRVMNWLDKNPNVVLWQSEEFCISYYDPSTNKIRRYFPDFLIHIKNKDGIKIWLVEVKPHNQSIPPEPQQKRTKSYITKVLTWTTNEAKWEAAKILSKERGWEFKVITERDLNIKF